MDMRASEGEVKHLLHCGKIFNNGNISDGDFYMPLSMFKKLERAKGLEPSTPTLARSCSTTELHPHPRRQKQRWRYMP